MTNAQRRLDLNVLTVENLLSATPRTLQELYIAAPLGRYEIVCALQSLIAQGRAQKLPGKPGRFKLSETAGA